MRLKSIFCDTEEAVRDLPKLDCQHTTFDPLKLLWQKLFSFMSREAGVDVITEFDYALYCRVTIPKEMEFSLNVGCVTPGFDLIGFTLIRTKGDEQVFKDFESRLSNYLGF